MLGYALGVGAATALGDWLSGKYNSIDDEAERKRLRELEERRNRLAGSQIADETNLAMELGAPVAQARYQLAGNPGAVLGLESQMRSNLAGGRRDIRRDYALESGQIGDDIYDTEQELEEKKAAEKQRRASTLLNPALAFGTSYLSNLGQPASPQVRSPYRRRYVSDRWE